MPRISSGCFIPAALRERKYLGSRARPRHATRPGRAGAQPPHGDRSWLFSFPERLIGCRRNRERFRIRKGSKVCGATVLREIIPADHPAATKLQIPQPAARRASPRSPPLRTTPAPGAGGPVLSAAAAALALVLVAALGLPAGAEKPGDKPKDRRGPENRQPASGPDTLKGEPRPTAGGKPLPDKAEVMKQARSYLEKRFD